MSSFEPTASLLPAECKPACTGITLGAPHGGHHSVRHLTQLQALHLPCSKLGTRVCTLDAALTAELNDKTTFSELCEKLGALVPKSFPITSKQRLYELNSRCAKTL